MKNLFAQHTEKEIEDGIYCIYQHFKIFWRQAAREEKADFGEPCAECEKYLNITCNLDWLANINVISPEGGFNPRLRVRPDKSDRL